MKFYTISDKSCIDLSKDTAIRVSQKVGKIASEISKVTKIEKPAIILEIITTFHLVLFMPNLVEGILRSAHSKLVMNSFQGRRKPNNTYETPTQPPLGLENFPKK